MMSRLVLPDAIICQDAGARQKRSRFKIGEKNLGDIGCPLNYVDKTELCELR